MEGFGSYDGCMNSSFTNILVLLGCLLSTLSAQTTEQKPSTEKVPLFDGKTMKGWYVFFDKREKDQDPDHVFTIADSCFHVSGQNFGYLSTEKEYANYKLTLSYKWGEKKWPPRDKAIRDAGIIYHAVGEDIVWCNGMEFQIQEGDTGDLFLIGGKENNPAVTVKDKKYGGTKSIDRVVKWSTEEKPQGEWNQCVLICKGKKFEHWVNGKLVMSGETEGREKGKIQLQSEGAEIWYRDITLEALP